MVYNLLELAFSIQRNSLEVHPDVYINSLFLFIDK